MREKLIFQTSQTYSGAMQFDENKPENQQVASSLKQRILFVDVLTFDVSYIGTRSLDLFSIEKHGQRFFALLLPRYSCGFRMNEYSEEIVVVKNA